MRVPLRRHIQSRSLSCCGIRLPDRSNAPVVDRPHGTGGTGAALRGHDRNDGLPPYRPPWKTNDGDLDCGTSCPLSGQMNGAPGRTRTSCLRFRKPPLCPGELRELGSPEDAGARLNATRFSCGTIRDMSDGFVRRQRRPATATCGPCNLSPPGLRTVRGEFRPPLVVYPYPLPLCCLSGSHLNDRSVLGQVQSPLGGVKAATGFDRSLKSNQRSRLPSRAPCRSDRSSKRAVIGTAGRNRRILDRGVPRPVM